MKHALSHLLSGTDIRGVAIESDAGAVTLTEHIGRSTGVAFARWLAGKCHKPSADLRVAVGRDSRLSGEALADAIIAGMRSVQVNVLDCGLCTTPAMYMSTVLLDCDGAVMVTASHLPWQRNGYKFFTEEGGLTGAQVEEILSVAAQTFPPQQEADAKAVDLLGIYTSFLKDKITAALGEDAPLAGLHVVIDAGNGAGGFFAGLLASLGADTTGSQFLEPDGRFPNHIPNPEDAGAMRAIEAAVVRAGADLGVIFDTDCDRAALVDSHGQAINRNRLIALVGAMLLAETPGVTLVSDSVTSAGLDAFIAARGGTLHRFKRGYRNVIDEAVRLNGEGVDCPLAIETSGHAALRENYFLDDGMYLAVRLIIKAKQMMLAGGRLEDLTDGLVEPVEAREARLKIVAEDFRAEGARVLEGIRQRALNDPRMALDPDNREGIRILFGAPDRWTMLRLSLHDPQIVINAESDETGGVATMLMALLPWLEAYPTLDLTALRACLEPTL